MTEKRKSRREPVAARGAAEGRARATGKKRRSQAKPGGGGKPAKRRGREPKIDFEKLFLKGHKSYDSAIGDWWHGQASNGAHQKAYRHVAEWIKAKLARPPRGARKPPRRPLIVDYACGSGFFLAILAEMLPEARIVALDGSRNMLKLAQARLAARGMESALVEPKAAFGPSGPRIRLVRTNLPNFSLPKGRADAVAFLFPNLTPAPGDQPYYDRHGYKNRQDVKVLKILSRLREMDPEDEVSTATPQEMYDGLMTDRVVSRNARHLLRRGGLWFKVDYANANRDELSHLTNMRSFFSEGALDEDVKGEWSERFFRYHANEFRKSQVILDVYHQTKDPSDKSGGYFISLFSAI